jgi:erythrin-vacuolar iron transport family protein
MATEENEHRRSLIDLYSSKFGNHIPLIRRQDVRGFVQRKKLWQVRLQGIEAIRHQARQMERNYVIPEPDFLIGASHGVRRDGSSRT